MIYPRYRQLHRLAMFFAILFTSVLSHGVELQFTDGWPVFMADELPLSQVIPGANAVEVIIDDTALLADAGTTKVSSPLPEDGLQTVHTSPRGICVDTLTPFPALGSEAWRRTLRYTNTSSTRQDLTGAVLRFAPVTRSGGEVWRPTLFWMGEAPRDRIFCAAYQDSHGDAYGLAVNGAVVESNTGACWRLEPGQSAEMGVQCLWFASGSADQFRAEAAKFFNAAGLHTPDNIPPWLPGAIYYKAAADGTIESRSSDVGGFRNFSRQLDYLADLGVTAMMYHSVQKHQTSPNPREGGWNVYGILDYDEVDPISGGAEGFRYLTDMTRLRGMHVLGEFGLNGYYSSQAAALRPWWTCGRDGEPIMSFGGASMDYACPEWRTEMAAMARRMAVEFGIEGARLDLGSGSGDNWSSPLGNHASYSNFGGSLEMLRALRDAMTISEYAPVIISEDMVHQPERLAMTPTLYGFEQKQILSQGLPPDLSYGAGINAALSRFFRVENGSLPSGALPVRTLNGLNELVTLGRTMYRFGPGLSRALYGVMLAVPGVTQMAQEEEAGSFEAYRSMNWARRRIPEFATGAADYDAITYDPAVFSVLRSGSDGHAAALCNLSGSLVEGEVRVAADLPEGAIIYDAISGQQGVINAGAFHWRLEPYAVAFFRIGIAPIGSVPSRRFAGEPDSVPVESASLGVTLVDGTLRVRSGRIIGELDICPDGAPWTLSGTVEGGCVYTCANGQATVAPDTGGARVTMESAPGGYPVLRVRNTRKWAVSGRTALLEDYTLRRHRVYPPEMNYRWDRTMVWGAMANGLLYNGVFPTGRLWQSILEPLHPDASAMVFTREAGETLVLTDIKSDARNIVLTDCSDEALSGMAPWADDPYGLETRFYAIDPDLHPRVDVFGLDTTWALPSYPKPEPRSMRVSFRLSAPSDPAPLLDARRLPSDRKSAERARAGERFIVSESETLFFARPGSITWALPEKAMGTVRIQAQLRQSAYGKDGREMAPQYTASLDGVETALEWKEWSSGEYGGAVFATVLTPKIHLDGGAHTFTLTTKSDWCALRRPFMLIVE